MYEFESNFHRKLIIEGNKIFEEHWKKVCVPAIEQAIATNPDAIFAVYEIDNSAAMRAIYSLLPHGVIPRSKLGCFHTVDEYLDARKELVEHFMECLKDVIAYYDIRKCAAEAAADKFLSDSTRRISDNNKYNFYANARNLVHKLWLNR